MTTLRLVSRQARRGVRFGGRDGAKKKRGRPKGQLGLAEDLADNVIVVGGMQSVNWEAVLEEERDAELKRREERRVKAEAEEKERKKREPSFNGFSSGSGGNTVSSSGKVVLKAEELEAALRGAVVDSDTEMVEVEVEVEEEIVDETEVAEPRIVNGREFRARKPPKKFRKVIKKVLVPKKKKGGSSAPIASDADDEPTSSGLPVIQKILSNVPPEILKRSQDPDDDVIYCICDLPDADVWNTVACDFCNIWYHIDCVGYMDPEIVPKSLHSSIKGLTKDGKWKCPRCRKEVLLIPTPLA
ncbi:hypothetical protein BCR33DRAFT_63405 [Rhizoclosmatium globosum]|uniref:PHD-type domain-containing protein n=1 Tax=Rhizoclosmatium globosum TaxID=329046 RepID=A0A1Y2CMN4_9FUNG|nr:hypothetical protein BCR33DRAFT_63405 [Rhizoclosmatium globosum]|eukprot:ORY48272.1 hypothetical protein BCR33DRAFT_63405 [Rhizoclosmatium globosum]